MLNKFSNPVNNDPVASIQANVINNLFSAGRLNRLAINSTRFGAANTYQPDELLDDVKKGVWSELASKKPVDSYRRNLQKLYTDDLINILNPPPAPSIQGLPAALAALLAGTSVKDTDIPSIVRAHLTALRNDILAAIPGTTDKLSRYHLLDVSERIRRALDPK